MASHSPDQSSPRRPGRRLAVFISAALVLSACRPGGFIVSGGITASPAATKRAAIPNTVLLIIAANQGGVPVAVKRIINPGFPLRYIMDEGNLVLPGPSWTGPLTITAMLSMHGTVGIEKKGDMRGVHRGTARPGDKDVNIVIDEIIVPK